MFSLQVLDSMAEYLFLLHVVGYAGSCCSGFFFVNCTLHGYRGLTNQPANLLIHAGIQVGYEATTHHAAT